MTREVEHLLYNHLWRKGWYGVFECSIPKCLQPKTHRERMDMISYETSGVYRVYEIKISKSDLHSKNALSFIGNFNYLVCPEDLVEDAKQILSNDIGIYAVYEHGNKRWIDLVRKPKHRELLCSSAEMQFAMLQSFSREYKKYRKFLEKQDKKSSSKGK